MEIKPVDKNGREIKSGDSVRVPVGVVVTGTFPLRTKVVGRTHTVKVNNAFSGWTKISDHPDDGPRAPKVSWAGSSGYWHQCGASEVEVVK